MSSAARGAMRTLFLLRHAKSSWDDPALPDHERPLAPRGLRDAKRIAKHVGRLGTTPRQRLEAKFPTAALVTLTLARWSNLSADNADLVAYVVPKQLH